MTHKQIHVVEVFNLAQFYKNKWNNIKWNNCESRLEHLRKSTLKRLYCTIKPVTLDIVEMTM